MNRNEIIPISDNSFGYLHAILTDKENDIENLPEELAKLKKSGYLSTQSAVKKIQHNYTRFLDIFLARKVGKITLQVTQNCNFRCRYCIYTEKEYSRQRTHSAKRMSYDNGVGFGQEQNFDGNAMHESDNMSLI